MSWVHVRVFAGHLDLALAPLCVLFVCLLSLLSLPLSILSFLPLSRVRMLSTCTLSPTPAAQAVATDGHNTSAIITIHVGKRMRGRALDRLLQKFGLAKGVTFAPLFNRQGQFREVQYRFGRYKLRINCSHPYNPSPLMFHVANEVWAKVFTRFNDNVVLNYYLNNGNPIQGAVVPLNTPMAQQAAYQYLAERAPQGLPQVDEMDM